MASILNTDLGDLYSQWGERVAFNEAFDRQKIRVMNEFAYVAINNGIDRVTAREQFFDVGLERVDRPSDLDIYGSAMAFNPEDPDGKWVDVDGAYPLDASGNDFYDTHGNSAYKKKGADVEPESIETDQIGEVLDGEDTLGMESVVANETEDVRHYSEEELDAIGPVDDDYDIPHLDEYHEYLHSTRDVGADFAGFHEWHMDSFGDFGIR